jgi:predicted porin
LSQTRDAIAPFEQQTQRRFSMNKKLMAVAVAGAVAGAVAAPELALAQITVLGRFVAEYGLASQMDQPGAGGPNGPSRDSADGFNSPASWIRFAGEEKLGGGNSVWAQCENRARWGVDTSPTQGSGGFCDRNSALGIKGSFGNFFVGRWDTAIEDSSGLTRIHGSTGWDGRQHMLTEDQSAGIISFAQRVQNSLNYNSPNFSGFAVNLSTTTTGAALNTSATASSQGFDGRIYSILAKYASGPLVGYVGYETHDDNQAVAAGGRTGASEEMVTFGLSYVFGPVKVGIVLTDFDGDGTTAGTDITRKAWQVAAEWKVTPAGTVRVGYTAADDFKGTDARAALADQGAKQYSLGYYHALSKRTILGAYYTKVDNDSNGRYNYHSFNSSVLPGDSAGTFALHAAHNF